MVWEIAITTCVGSIPTTNWVRCAATPDCVRAWLNRIEFGDMVIMTYVGSMVVTKLRSCAMIPSGIDNAAIPDCVGGLAEVGLKIGFRK